MVKLRPSLPEDGSRVVEIWAAAVDATHGFLSPEDRAAIGAEVEAFLPGAPLTLAVDDDGRVVGFMLVESANLEALFVDPSSHGRGFGRMLVEHALRREPGLALDVNAQNDGACAFYNRLGFIETGRSRLDRQGRPYPLIHMRHRS